MTDETPGTRTDPETTAEGDTDQLPPEDTLVDRGGVDPVEEGYSPPERDRTGRWGETEWEQEHDEPMDRRLAAEQPDVGEEGWQQPDTTRAGRLVADDDADADADSGPRDNDVYGEDVGIDAAGASAEEAAVHWTEEP